MEPLFRLIHKKVVEEVASAHETIAPTPSEDKTVLRAAMEDKTIAVVTPSKKTVGPRLVLATASGKNEVYPVFTGNLTIGRGSEAGVRLNDPEKLSEPPPKIQILVHN